MIFHRILFFSLTAIDSPRTLYSTLGLIDINSMITLIGKDGNNKVFLHNMPNTNVENLGDLSLNNRLVCLNTIFQIREGKCTYLNNSKPQLDCIFISKKWITSPLNCETYTSFEGTSSDHRIVWAKIRLSLRRNTKQTTKALRRDWSSFTTSDIRNQYTAIVIRKFDNLQETSEIHSPKEIEIILDLI